MAPLQTIREVDPKALNELRQWIETWLPSSQAAETGFIRFNSANDELPVRYLVVTTTDDSPDGIGIFVVAGGDNDAVFGSVEGPVEIRGDQISFVSGDGTVGTSFLNIPLAAGGLVQVRDSGGNRIFEVHEDGSVHIPTGTSIIADL